MAHRQRHGCGQARAALSRVLSGAPRSAQVALRGDDRVAVADAVLADFARWPFGGEGRGDDRLDLLQRTFGQALPGDADENARALLAALPTLLAEAKAQYAAFLDDQLDEYAKQRQATADYAADVAKKVADSVEVLTKGPFHSRGIGLARAWA